MDQPCHHRESDQADQWWMLECGPVLKQRKNYVLRSFIVEDSRPTDGKPYQKILIVLIKYTKRRKERKTEHVFAKFWL